MAERLKIRLSISKAAVDVLNKHVSARRRGDFVSQVLESYEVGSVSRTDLETLKLQIRGLASQLKGHDARFLYMERQIAALAGKGYG